MPPDHDLNHRLLAVQLGPVGYFHPPSQQPEYILRKNNSSLSFQGLNSLWAKKTCHGNEVTSAYSQKRSRTVW